MLHRRQLLAGAAALLAAPAVRAQPTPRLPVVASFTIVGDFCRLVGGDRIQLTTLVGPDGDAHVFQPRPADGRALAAARLVVMNGLGFEGWMARLVRSSGARGTVVEAARGVTPIRVAPRRGHSHGHAHGEADPHAWQSAKEAKAYVAAIRDALVAADADGRAAYEANAAAALRDLDALDAEIRAEIGRIPEADRRAVTTHDAFAYFQRDYGFTFLPAVGLSTEAEPTPQQIARLIRQVRETGVKAVFAESISDPRLVQRIAREGGARVGGALYSDALSPADGPAPTYMEMMRHNVRTITAAIVQA
jgi:zinc/manganese transport system substrate-binding protein